MGRTADELADWQGYLTRGEVGFLKRLAGLLPARPIIVNIGAGAGTSTLAFLEARPDCIVVSIDLLTTESEVTTNEHLRLAEIDAADAARVIRVWGDSKIVGRAWPWAVDMVFVDGDHIAAGVKADIDAWLPHVKPGSIIAFHDYTRKAWPDVKRVVDEAMRGYSRIDHVDTTIAFWGPE